jgi:coenzyme F420-reducing hydrogenase delta subunit
VAYCCRYCAYAAADLAGVLRLQYPADAKVVQIPCSGRLDTLEVMHAFEHGADAVMVSGCLEGDCHFQSGNLAARQRVKRIKALLGEIGMEPSRIEMFNMSSAMGRQFAEAVRTMTGRISELGPSPLRSSAEKDPRRGAAA